MTKEILRKLISVKNNIILQKTNESPESSNWKLKIADRNKKARHSTPRFLWCDKRVLRKKLIVIDAYVQYSF